MPISKFQYEEMLLRLDKNRAREQQPVPPDCAEKEVKELHTPILEWLNNQLPRVAYIHARTDTQSTIAIGAPDFTIFYHGAVLLIECKTRTGKLSIEQMAWRLKAEGHGFTVHVIRSMKEFHQLINEIQNPTPPRLPMHD